MKVVNVKADEVFQKLAAGIEVYVVNVNDDILCNLLYEQVNEILDCINSDKNAFFITESEDK